VIEIDVRDAMKTVERKLNRLRDDVRDKATVMALNKTAAKAKTEMTRAITSEFNLKAAEVRSRLRIRRASQKGSNLVAILDPYQSTHKRGRSLNLIHFLENRVTIAEMKRRRKRGTHKYLRFKIKKHGGVRTIKGAFIGNKGRTIFQRDSGERMPISPMQVIDVPQMFNTKRINRRVIERIQREFPVEFERAARHVIDRFNHR